MEESELAVIVLAGMIGIGKSSYAEMLGEHYGSEVFYESVESNPVLEKFYSDQKRYGFLLQIHFLNTRFQSIKKALSNRKNVLDRSIYEDSYFTYVNWKLGSINDEEKMVYDSLLENMMEELEGMPKKAPDLLVYLKGSFDTVLQRIIKRGRPYEQDPSLIEYYRVLHQGYDDWVLNHYKYSPVLVIDAGKYDISLPENQEAVKEMVDNKLKEMGAL